MTRGGHANSGPPPQRDSLRQRDTDWTHLPAGREGDPPDWPLSTASARERTLWASEWRRPQAVMWESLGLVLEVALFVRAVIVAEGRKSTATDRGLPLRYMEDLGISASGLARRRWVIDGDTGATNEVRHPATSAGGTAKERLKLVVND